MYALARRGTELITSQTSEIAKFKYGQVVLLSIIRQTSGLETWAGKIDTQVAQLRMWAKNPCLETYEDYS